MGPYSGCEPQRDCLICSDMVPSRFGDESNYAGDIVTGGPCGSVAQWFECSQGKRETLSSSPARAMFFFIAYDIRTIVFSDTKYS